MATSDTPTVDQRKASAAGDNVGRDKTTKNIHINEQRSQIDGWLERLSEEMRQHADIDFVDNLQYFFQPFKYDEHVGLEAKLNCSGRSSQKALALRKKEAFSKLLEKWKAYPAAQEIIAYFLSRIDSNFESEILPHLGTKSIVEVDELIKVHLVDPVLLEMGCGPFMLNATNVSGMVYWLAEQCYIRWHA